MNAGRNNRQVEVICLHCGMNTPVPESTSGVTDAGLLLELDHHISIVRCRSCGKEAPYLTADIVVFAEAANTARIGA